MPRIKRARPNARMARLAVPVLILLALAFGVWELAFGRGPDGETGTQTTVTVGRGDQVARVDVGEPFAVGDLNVVVTASFATLEPTGARWPITAGAEPGLAEGQAYFQVYVRAENVGEKPARIDPRGFALDTGGSIARPEPTLTGPGARTLLKGATFDFIVTFRGPAGREPRVIFRPLSGGEVIIEGSRMPAAFTGAP